MFNIKEAGTRGEIDHGWLHAKHSFSFGRYQDPENMGFRSLRVLNEDVIAPGRGFPSHPHHDMEILTYPISGTLRHTDSLGHEEDITVGTVQRMSAGSGIRHSERNPSKSTPVHLLQIWIEPREKGLEPSHETRAVAVHDEPNGLHLIASGLERDSGNPDAMVIHQDARMLGAVLEPGRTIEHTPVLPHVWVQVVKGAISVNGHVARAGDAVRIEDAGALAIEAREDSEFVLFELS